MRSSLDQHGRHWQNLAGSHTNWPAPVYLIHFDVTSQYSACKVGFPSSGAVGHRLAGSPQGSAFLIPYPLLDWEILLDQASATLYRDASGAPRILAGEQHRALDPSLGRQKASSTHYL
jgi:hypothetical protein